MTVPYTKKLIEVALPLEAINAASAREKSIRHGHPSTLHLWWARRPLAAARAVIFAQMVDDPSSRPDLFPNEAAQEKERNRLFGIIEELVKWENTTNEEVLEKARAEIWQSWRRACAENVEHPQAKELFDRHKLPAFHDPFAGGGALPLEAQRLGLEAYASDLNPVAVLINKAMIEIPPKFAGQPPVNPDAKNSLLHGADETSALRGRGAQGLADDVRYYGQWMRDEAEKRIGHLYPKVEITAEMVRERPDLEPYKGKKLTVIAWLWARTVKSPNPAYAQVDVPLVSTFMLSTKAGKEAYVEPVIELGNAGDPPAECEQDARAPIRAPRCGYRFTVKVGKPKDPEAAKKGTTAGKRSAFRCLMSDVPVTYDYIRLEGQADRIDAKLMSIVAEGNRGRIYLSPMPEHEIIAGQAQPEWKPDAPLYGKCRVNVSNYGLDTFGDLFTPRQLVALTTFSDLAQEARERVKQDYLGALGARTSCPSSADETSSLPKSSADETSTLPKSKADKTSSLQEWHSRGFLPHWEAGEVPQHIVFRLHDSLPRELRERWEDELRTLPKSEAEHKRREHIEAALDRGYGSCFLHHPDVAQVVQNALLHFDGERYTLHAWVIMPNHVHVLATPLNGSRLSSILHSWKSYTAKEANRILGRTGTFWMEEYFDRVMRNEKHFAATEEYIENNPVKAGLCTFPEEWQWSSAYGERARHAGEGEESARHAGKVEEMRTRRPRSHHDDLPLANGGTGAQAYADAVAVYLGFAIDRCADFSNTCTRWVPGNQKVMNLFGKQAIAMTWDYPEAAIMHQTVGGFIPAAEFIADCIGKLPQEGCGDVSQQDAMTSLCTFAKVVSTDPPYYDNIGYADLSDFFYVWLRRSLKPVFPDLFATLAVPKAEELVATPYRHGSKEKAETFFLDGMTKAMRRLAEQAHPAFPVTIYYAFKQSETAKDGTASTGWETFLGAVIRAGFAVTGTWPIRTEYTGNLKKNMSALASSIVLVCRKRPEDAPTATRREFLAALKRELPAALAHLQRGNIAPVDLAQASIGPGMAVYTRYAKVIDAEGKALTVREALTIINQTLDEALAEQEGDFDSDTRWALAWFDQYGYKEAEFGQADVLARAKNTSVAGLEQAGVIFSKGGKVRLLKPDELRDDWDPVKESRLTVWEVSLYMIRSLESGGETAAANIRAQVGAHAGAVRELAYRQYTLCERKKWAQEALAFNSLVISWPEIERLARDAARTASMDQLEDLPGF